MQNISAAVDLAPEKYRKPLVQVIDQFNITNPVEFLATVYYESKYLTKLVEDLNYQADVLLKKFSRKRISYDDAMRFGKSPRQKKAFVEAIGNRIYGGDYGRINLGNIHEGDGWFYRGQGPIQLTGRGAWEAFAAYVGRPQIGDAPEIALEDPLLCVMTSGWFWRYYKPRNLSTCGSDMRAITKLVTGAPDTAIKTRIEVRDHLLEVLKETA